MKINTIILLFLGYACCLAQTKKNVDNQSLLWTRYYNQLTLNNKWAVHSEFDNRIFTNPIKQNLYEFRVQARYKINGNIDIGAGLAYFSVATQDPEIDFPFDFPEYRSHQDLIWKQDIGKITLIQRFQIEERFFQKASKEKLLSGTLFFWRFRYRIQAEHTFWEKDNQFLKAIVFDELMINGGENVDKNRFDQNRVYLALQYGVNKNIALELGYLNSFQKRANGLDYFDRDIIRFTFYHKINL
jgi:hypothetical protein